MTKSKQILSVALVTTALLSMNNMFVHAQNVDTETAIISENDVKANVSSETIEKIKNGIVQETDGIAYYIDNQLQEQFTGLKLVNDTVYYFENGYVNTTYTGVENFENRTVYIKNGVVEEMFTGVVEFNGIVYTFDKGKIVVNSNEANHQPEVTNFSPTALEISEVNLKNASVVIRVPNGTGTVSVWSAANGKDDLVYYPVFDGKVIVRLSNHQYVSGAYYVEYNGAVQQVNWNLPENRVTFVNELADMKKEFDKLFNGLSGQKSLYITPIDGFEYVSVDDSLYKPASAIKLFILAAAYAKDQRGEINLNQYYKLKSSDIVNASALLANRAGSSYTYHDYAKMMITHSDNTATNVLIDFIGGVNAVNQEIKRLGYTKTHLQRYMQIQSQIKAGLENYLSTQEAADLIKNIYNRTLTTQKSDELMLSYLAKNHWNIFLAAKLPISREYYGKPGGYPSSGIEGETVVFGRNGVRYAIALMTNNMPSVNRSIREFGLSVYNIISTKTRWIQVGQDWYYKNIDGQYVKNNWVDSSYYMKADGKMAINEWIYDNNYKGYYYLDHNGVYVKNSWIGSYYTKSDGKRAVNEWIYDSQNKAWYYLNENGEYVANTWQGNYYLKQDGKMAVSEWIKDSNDNSWYYVDKTGAYVSNVWQEVYYLKSDGKMAVNEWLYDKNYSAHYYLGESGAYTTHTWIGIYYTKGNGKRAISEWIYDNHSSAWYYIDENGERVSEVWRGNYYLKSDGQMAINEWIYDKTYNAYYYLDENGVYVKNRWQGIYYVKEDGKRAVNSWIQDHYDNAWYYMDATGVYVTNRWQDNYYLKEDGRRAMNIWIHDDSKGAWYYIDNTGRYVSNTWQGIYYLGADGKMLTATWTPDGYYVDETGKWVEGKVA